MVALRQRKTNPKIKSNMGIETAKYTQNRDSPGEKSPPILSILAENESGMKITARTVNRETNLASFADTIAVFADVLAKLAEILP